MTVNKLLNMYKWMRFALFVTVPVAMWGLVYWMSKDTWISLLFAFGMMLPLFDILPSMHEVRHRMIQERRQMDTIWFKLI